LLWQSAASTGILLPREAVAFDAWAMRTRHLGVIVGIHSRSAKRKARKKFSATLEHI
jgi:hypothetical protein